jgi:hypothetical protein
MSEIDRRRRDFVRSLAEYLVGNQVERSIELSMHTRQAIQWAHIRSLTPLLGYPTVDEAEDTLREFLMLEKLHRPASEDEMEDHDAR